MRCAIILVSLASAFVTNVSYSQVTANLTWSGLTGQYTFHSYHYGTSGGQTDTSFSTRGSCFSCDCLSPCPIFPYPGGENPLVFTENDTSVTASSGYSSHHVEISLQFNRTRDTVLGASWVLYAYGGAIIYGIHYGLTGRFPARLNPGNYQLHIKGTQLSKSLTSLDGSFSYTDRSNNYEKHVDQQGFSNLEFDSTASLDMSVVDRAAAVAPACQVGSLSVRLLGSLLAFPSSLDIRTMEVFSPLGICVAHYVLDANRSSVDLSELPAGLYFIRLDCDVRKIWLKSP